MREEVGISAEEQRESDAPLDPEKSESNGQWAEIGVLAIKAQSPEPSAIDVTSVPRRPMRSGTGAITGAAMIEASVSTVSGSATTGTGKSNSAAMRCGTGWKVCNRSVPANMADSSSGSRPAGAVLTPLRPSGATGPPPPPTSQP